MIQGETVLAVIPARGGSKGIKDKNIYPICGKPLLSYTIEAAQKSRYLDRILISTDSKVIASLAEEHDLKPPFLRPPELAKDHSKSIDVVIHALKYLKDQGEDYDILVLLQPTQPLRTTQDIDSAIEHFVKSGKKPLVSVSEVDDHPLLIRKMDGEGLLQPLLLQGSTVRRQDMSPYYRVNGCIYINCAGELDGSTSFNDNQVPYFMPRERAVDIDEPKDIALVEFYLKHEKYKNQGEN